MKLNFLPLTYEHETYTIYRITYQDDEQLKNLRDNHNGTNSFFRDGNYIYHSPMEKEGSFCEGEKVKLNINQDIDITKKLLHHLIFRLVLRKKCIMAKFAPIEFFRPERENDLLNKFLNQEEKKKVGYWKGFKIDSRVFKRSNSPVYGIALNIFYNWKIKIDCKSVVEMGLDLSDRYVEVYDKEFSKIFKTNRKLVGKVVAYNDDTATIEKEGEEAEYNLSELFLENSYQNKQDILGSFLGEKKAKSNFNQLSDTTQSRAGAKGKYDSINNLLEWLKTFEFSNHHGFSFTLGDFIKKSDNLWETINIPSPTFIFNYHNTQTDKWHDRGLREYGPYSKDNFSPTKPKVAVFFRKDKRGDVSKFVGKFKNGLPNIKTKGQTAYQPYGQGFTSKYRFSGIDFKPYEVKDETIDSYEAAIRRMLEENEDNIHLAIVESCQAYKELAPEINPYFFTKAKLLKHGIPSQEVLFENMILPDKNLAYLLNNIGLASYAKLGGVPWVTPASQNADHELVIGIGNQIFKEGRFNISRRIVGITTLFSSDGNYLLSSASKDVPYEYYLEELKRSLAINIGKIQKKHNWMAGDVIRLVFHVFKPFNNEEIEAVEKMVEELKNDFEVLFAYINISHRHPYLIFDKNQNGIWDPKNYGKKKGIWQPERKVNIKIDDNQFLLQLVGPREIKTWRQGMASPVLVKLHEKSSFTDIDYLTRQIYNFSCISWRGFQPASLPVTLDYSNQIAKILGNLRRSGHWTDDLLPNKLKFNAWFL